MGLATAAQLLTQGVTADVVGNNLEKLHTAKNQLSPKGRINTHQVNLLDSNTVSNFVDRLRDQSFDYLVNAAGIFSPNAFIDHTNEEYDRYAGLNKATFLITQAVVKNMQKQQFGAIVNIGSMCKP